MLSSWKILKFFQSSFFSPVFHFLPKSKSKYTLTTGLQCSSILHPDLSFACHSSCSHTLNIIDMSCSWHVHTYKSSFVLCLVCVFFFTMLAHKKHFFLSFLCMVLYNFLCIITTVHWKSTEPLQNSFTFLNKWMWFFFHLHKHRLF